MLTKKILNSLSKKMENVGISVNCLSFSIGFSYSLRILVKRARYAMNVGERAIYYLFCMSFCLNVNLMIELSSNRFFVKYYFDIFCFVGQDVQKQTGIGIILHFYMSSLWISLDNFEYRSDVFQEGKLCKECHSS